MVKIMQIDSVLLIAIVMAVGGMSAGEPVTADSIKGKDIMPKLSMTLPYRDCSTPEKAFLGFLRSNAQGNLKDYLFYHTPQAKKAIAGVEDENEISDEKTRDCEEAFKKAEFGKFRLESFQTVPYTSPTQIVAVVTSSRGKLEMRDRFDIAIVQTNGLWKFEAVIISPIERKRADNE
ncbi:MAG: hypothetical protein GX230_00855 [Lentisphaerae bacterium]|jgi:hypothetical protein|nr:hypothetical protein [Lentisphaerota bacterium]